MKYKREIALNSDAEELLGIKDSVISGGTDIEILSVFTKDTYVYVPSSRYYTLTKEPPVIKNFPQPVGKAEIDWKIRRDTGVEVAGA